MSSQLTLWKTYRTYILMSLNILKHGSFFVIAVIATLCVRLELLDSSCAWSARAHTVNRGWNTLTEPSLYIPNLSKYLEQHRCHSRLLGRRWRCNHCCRTDIRGQFPTRLGTASHEVEYFCSVEEHKQPRRNEYTWCLANVTTTCYRPKPVKDKFLQSRVSFNCFRYV